MKAHLIVIASNVFILLLLAACAENPVANDEHEDDVEDLEVTLTLSKEHVHTLSSIDFTVEVRDHHGDMVTDFEQVTVERRLKDASEWRAIELTRDGDTYHGSYTFMSSGAYELRVAGMLPGHDEMEVLHHRDAALEVVRAHTEVREYRIEFENFPGHVHEGDTAEIKFWVLEDDGEHRHTVEGLAAEIHCEDANGATEEHIALENETGVYMAEHIFAEAGEAHLAIHFIDANGTPVEADFHLPVAPGH